MWWTVVIRYVRVSVFSLCMRGLTIIILNTGSTNMYVLLRCTWITMYVVGVTLLQPGNL